MTYTRTLILLLLTTLFLSGCTQASVTKAATAAPAPIGVEDEATIIPPAATTDPAPLTYPIVDTGQTTCYDTQTAIPCPTSGQPYYGQDGQISGHTPSYTRNGDGAISDTVTGLMWTQTPDTNGDGSINISDKFTYTDAISYCDALTLANYDDWRLPSIKELYSLIDFRGTDPGPGSTPQSLTPFIDTTYFAFGYGDESAGERILDAQFASSTLYVSTVMHEMSAMFGVNFGDGRIKGYPINSAPGIGTKTYYVLCVRGNESYGQNEFVANGDGTISDQATGLMWAQDDNATPVNWVDALAWVAEMNAANYLGYNDWRLPNAKELQSILDYGRSPATTSSAALDPLFNATLITNEAGQADYGFYWSSTTHLRFDGTTTDAVYVAFGRGLGSMDGVTVIDVHGAGAQRTDPKEGDPDAYPVWGIGPQGDVRRVFNFVRLVRDVETAVPEPSAQSMLFIPLVIVG